MNQPGHPQTEPPTLGEHNGYPIYPMPAFVALTARDLKATVAFFTEALDFGQARGLSPCLMKRHQQESCRQ